MARGLVRAGGRVIEDGDLGTILKATTTTSTTSATAVDVAGLAFTPAAGATYLLDGYLLISSAVATTGVRVAVVWPTGVTGAINMVIPQTDTTEADFFTATSGALATSGSGVTTQRLARVEGLLVAATTGLAAGTVRVQVASEVALTSVSVLAGSLLVYRPV